MQTLAFFRPYPFKRLLGRLISLLIFALSLSACGGGGDNGDSSAASTDTPSYTLQGVISTESYLEFDSDTNDSASQVTANNSIATAQPIYAPATINGYVNIAGSGSEGHSFASGDSSDFYEVGLTNGESIALRFPDATAANLDLFLYDSNGTLADASMGTGASETLSSSGTGTFYVEVRAVSGASRYTLGIAREAVSRDIEEMHLSDDFIPGDVIVRFREDKSLTASALSTPETLDQKAEELGLAGLAGAPGRAMRMGFRTDSTRSHAFSTLGISQASSVQSTVQAEKLDTIRLVQALRQRGDIASADLNYRHYISAIPDDTGYADQAWHYELINLPEAWDKTTGSDSVIVAVVDTGVLLNHPDLNGRLVDGYDFISDPTAANDGDGIDDNPDDPGDKSNDNGTSSFHGTHVAGTIAAASNNATGVAGVTWNGKIMPLRVLGLNGGTDYDIIQALRFAAGLENDSGILPESPADVINLSLGGGNFSLTEQALFNQLHNELDIIVVAAAGNSGISPVEYPAAYDGVVAVGAVDQNGNLSYYSNYGTDIDVAAPGGDGYAHGYSIYSTCGDDSDPDRGIQYTYCYLVGTSMATPHVAGVAALMKGTVPDLTANDFDLLLRNGLITDSEDTVHSNYYGYGIIDADKAVTWAQDNQPIPPTLITTPAAFNFGVTTDSSTLEISIEGSVANGDISITSDASWLSADPIAIDGNGVGSYAVRVNRNNLPPSAYSGNLTFSPEASEISPVVVNVTMLVEAELSLVNGGFFHIGLIDPETADILHQTAGTLTGGQLAFRLSDIPTGTYYLYAGSDIDNNGEYQEEGETLGAFGSLLEPQILNITGDRNDLNFDMRIMTIK